jgi:hypothetical protein
MQLSKLVSCLRLVFIILFFSSLVVAEENQLAIPLEGSSKEIIKITEKGLEPKILSSKGRDSSVFLLNTTEKRKFDLEIDFGKNRMHCHTKNLTVGENGVIRTNKPILPLDFAVLCFPDSGVYGYTVKESGGSKATVYRGEVSIN